MIAMLSTLALVSLILMVLHVRADRKSRERWISKEGMTAEQVAQQPQQQRWLPEKSFYEYHKTFVSLMLTVSFYFFVWATIHTLNEMRSKQPNATSSTATGRETGVDSGKKTQ